MLAIHNLAFARNYQFLFTGINCTVQPGELLQISGKNGSGKTTLLRIMAGLLEPEEGVILWHEKPIHQQRETYSQQLHYIGHKNGVRPYLTVYENLKLFDYLLGYRYSGSLKEILKQMNLSALMHKQALHLSAGQLRRLCLAKLLLNSSPLWILDEPTTTLDAEGQQLLTSLLLQHLTNDGMVVLATHQPLSINGKIIDLEQYHA
jgi:heme exporter protein A